MTTRPPGSFDATAAPAPRRGEWVALGLVALVLLAPITWGVDPLYSWDVDAIAPGAVLRAFAARFGTHWHGSYGPVPYFMYGIVTAPILALFRATGELGSASASYPWGFHHPERSMEILIVGARLVSVALALGMAVMALRDARRQGVQRAWIAPVLLLGSAVYAYYGRTTNVDIFMFFWLWLGFHLLETPAASFGTLACAAAAATLAVCSKEQCAPLAVVVCAGAMWEAGRARAPGARVARALGVGAAALAAYVVVWRLPFGLPGWREHHHYIFTVAKYPRTYPLTAGGILALAAQCLRELPIVTGPALLLAAVIGALRPAFWSGTRYRAFGVLLYLAGFIATIGYVYPRFLFPLVFLGMPLGTRALESLADATRPLPRLAFAGILALTVVGGPFVSAAMLVDPRLTAEHWIAQRLARDPGVVEVAGNPRYQARLPHSARVVFTRADSLGEEAQGPVGDLVLVSAIDRYTFERAPEARTWWEALNAQSPARWERVAFDSPRFARAISGLPVAPTVWVYVRTDPQVAPPPHGR